MPNMIELGSNRENEIYLQNETFIIVLFSTKKKNTNFEDAHHYVNVVP